MRGLTLAISLLCVFSFSGNAFGQETTDPEALARRLLNSQGCKACHAFEGGNTVIGPNLAELSKGLNRTELALSLVNPEHRHGKGKIPDFSHLKAAEIDALVSFLHGLLPEGEKTTPNLRSAPETQSGQPNRSEP